MRDIVFKPSVKSIGVEHTETLLKPAEIISPTKFPEVVVEPSKSVANRLKSLIVPKRTLTLLTPARRPIGSQLPTVRKPAVLPIVVAQLKPQQERLFQQLNTPLGRVTALQGAALIALFAFVITTNRHSVLQNNSALTVAEAAPSLRQFLPTSPEAEKSLAIPSVLANAASTGSLSVWAAPWNLDSIAKSTTHYKYVSAFWLDLGSDSKSVVSKTDWSAWDTYRKATSSPGTQYYVTISANPEFSSKMIANASLRDAHISALLTQVQAHNFDGIDIDYEGLGRENRTAFTDFITVLSKRFHAQNKNVSVSVEARIANDVPMDWHALGQQADQVRIMAYDYHSHSTGTPGSISPLGWVQEITEYATSQVDPRKTIIGLGDYGYDWIEPDSNTPSWEGVGVSREQAIALAKTYSQSISRQTGIDQRGYDIGSIPQFSYTDATGKRHQVWYEDADSLQAKTILVQQYHPASIILWTAGLAQATSANQKGSNE